MSSVINYHADKQAWLDERQKGIGASEASAMLGLNPFWMPFIDRWAIKMSRQALSLAFYEALRCL